jgi:hypothetical protein
MLIQSAYEHNLNGPSLNTSGVHHCNVNVRRHSEQKICSFMLSENLQQFQFLS